MPTDLDIEFYEGPPIASASAAVDLLKTFDPDSVIESLAYEILDQVARTGIESLTLTEAEFAALFTYQATLALDGFAAVFYNDAKMVSHMLRATERTGAIRARDILVQGLNALGLTPDAPPETIAEAAERLVRIVSRRTEPVGEDAVLWKTINMLQDVYEDEIEHLSLQMEHLLTLNVGEFSNFP